MFLLKSLTVLYPLPGQPCLPSCSPATSPSCLSACCSHHPHGGPNCSAGCAQAQRPLGACWLCHCHRCPSPPGYIPPLLRHMSGCLMFFLLPACIKAMHPARAPRRDPQPSRKQG
eukprot:EG_transcript_18779